MSQQSTPSKMLLIILPASIIALMMILGKIDTPVTNVLFYLVVFSVMGLVVSSLVKDYRKKKN
ncbi:hypothetical protein NST32_13135 [Bacillus sp. FSL L8-0215]|uniref:hypothetical protein n=1 Tax=Bacillus TaxID=1386 RepID=UPI002E283BC0|nr:hypothetical protein [Bacillus safensis]MED5222915.1 hypothetical protein [Bacillus safensis]